MSLKNRFYPKPFWVLAERAGYYIVNDKGKTVLSVGIRFEQKRIQNISKDESLSGGQRGLLLGEVELMQGVSAFNKLKKMAPYFENAWRMLKRPTLIYDVESDWTLPCRTAF